MENYILFVGCLILFIAILSISKKEIVTPKVLFSFSFLISTFLFMLNTNIWHYNISIGTVIFIWVSIISFSLSSAGRCYSHTTKLSNNVKIGSKIFIVFSIIEVIGIIVRLLTIMEIVGNISSGDLSALREEEVETSYEMYLKFLTPSITCIAIYAIADFYNERTKKTKRYFKSIVLLIGYFIYCALSSARIEIIYLFIYFLVFYLIVFYKGRMPRLTPKLLIRMSVVLIIAIAAFFGLGFLTGKSQGQVNVFDNVSIYACSSIGALDYYLINDFHYSVSNMFTLTMKGGYNFLPYLGVRADLNVPEELNYVMYGDMNHNTNIYTCLRTPLHDYNYFGCIIFIFIEGIVYNILYKGARRAKSVVDIPFVLYLYVSPFILLSAISERFCASFTTITTIVFILFIKFTRKYVMEKGYGTTKV